MKLAILDKDGTIIRPSSGKTFVQAPEDQELIPGAKEAANRLIQDGYLIVLCSNQDGVAAGYKSLESAIAEMKFACELIGCSESYFCPCGPGSKGDYCIEVSRRGYQNYWFNREWSGTKLVDNFIWNGDYYTANQLGFRKPNPGMLKIAIEKRARRPKDIVMIGDRPEDHGAAAAAGVRFLDAAEWINHPVA